MDFSLTDEQKARVESASRFAGSGCAPTAIDFGLQRCRRPEQEHLGAAEFTCEGPHDIRALNIGRPQTGIAAFGN
ncbi:hypothetical protein [Zoogloea sp.]|uniref:hypothetical protein n=1 Tax=Zoogloea sp. TaxID=49181 RepID=UPI002633624E|nr:hypothetical protein [Zoogloea sp.]